MKEQEQYENVVNISFAGHLNVESLDKNLIDDPLEDLMNEFTDYQDKDVVCDSYEGDTNSIHNILANSLNNFYSTQEVLSALDDLSKRKAYFLEELVTYAVKNDSNL